MQRFDYDNRRLTVLLRPVVTTLAGLGCFYAYLEGMEIRNTPPEGSLLLAMSLFGLSIFFCVVGLRRRRYPHFVMIDDTRIDLPPSQLSKRHTSIPLRRIRSITIREFRGGDHLIEILYKDVIYEIAECLFDDRRDFQRVRAELERACPESVRIE